jgi:predicted RNase H-like HicB family nuclease
MKIKFTMSLRGATRYDEKARIYVGYCPALNVYSQGRTQSEAMEALRSILGSYLETCYEHGILHSVLTKAGFTAVSSGAPLPPQEACEEFIMIEKAHFDKVFEMDVPLELVATSTLREQNAAARVSCA